MLLPALTQHIQAAESPDVAKLAGSFQKEHAPRVVKRLLESQIKAVAKKHRQGGVWKGAAAVLCGPAPVSRLLVGERGVRQIREWWRWQ